ncbi:MAG: hypothetical protein I8H91_12770 [Burkholderiales bacterium]|nr:hypothetical protein [Burkholderiales bacterium]
MTGLTRLRQTRAAGVFGTRPGIGFTPCSPELTKRASGIDADVHYMIARIA